MTTSPTSPTSDTPPHLGPDSLNPPALMTHCSLPISLNRALLTSLLPSAMTSLPSITTASDTMMPRISDVSILLLTCHYTNPIARSNLSTHYLNSTSKPSISFTIP